MRVPPVLRKTCLAKAFILIAVTAMLAGAPRTAAAEDWPKRPITVVLAFAGGSMSDVIGRTLANDLSAAIGQPVVIEVRAGGGGVVAGAYVAKAPPDGYTLLLTAVGPAVLRPLIDKTLGYDTDADFTPIILVGDSPNVLLASPKLGVNTLTDLLAYAKQKDNKISVGHSGPGTMGHLCSVVFASLAGIDANSISYRGTPPMLTDLLGGQIDTGFPAYNPATKSAKILAVTTEERVDFLPGVPTMKESGFDVVGSTWFGIFGPAHMPPEIVAKINGVMDASLKKSEYRARFGEQGLRLLGGPPAGLSERVAQDRAKWAPIIAGLNLGADNK
jgi:tripartite-type tricarboxylate transporter receptor subunit TctC